MENISVDDIDINVDAMKGQVIRLRCCTCGKTQDVLINKPIEFGFELACVTKDAGWCPGLTYGAIFVFCSEECMQMQLTKDGYFRKKFRKIERK